MELLGNLKDKVAKSKSIEEARGIIEDAGMRLMDDELEMVTGGMSIPRPEEDRKTTDHAPLFSGKGAEKLSERIAQSGGYTSVVID